MEKLQKKNDHIKRVENKTQTFSNYLKLEFSRRQSVNQNYSLRAFAKDLKLPASRLSELFNGVKNISLARALKATENLKVSGHEKKYVENLAYIELSKKDSEKLKAQQKLSQKYLNQTKNMPAKNLVEISDWHYFAILELMANQDVPNQISFICQKLNLNLKVCELALDRLERNGYIFLKDGLWKTANKSIHIDSEDNHSIQKIHQQVLNLASQSFTNSHFNQREFNSGFVTLTEEEAQLIKNKMRDFAYDLFEEIKTNRQQRKANENLQKNEFTVYCVSSQLFPIEKKKKSNSSIFNSDLTELYKGVNQ